MRMTRVLQSFQQLFERLYCKAFCRRNSHANRYCWGLQSSKEFYQQLLLGLLLAIGSFLSPSFTFTNLFKSAKLKDCISMPFFQIAIWTVNALSHFLSTRFESLTNYRPLLTRQSSAFNRPGISSTVIASLMHSRRCFNTICMIDFITLAVFLYFLQSLQHLWHFSVSLPEQHILERGGYTKTLHKCFASFANTLQLALQARLLCLRFNQTIATEVWVVVPTSKVTKQ